MLRGNIFGPTLATLALLAAGSASADAIQFTGNVEHDFQGSGVVQIVDFGGSSLDVAQTPSVTGITGWNIQDLRLAYDNQSDTLHVGVNFFSIAGDADGNGDPGGADPATSAAGGIDLPHLGGRESISVGFDLQNRRVTDVVAGVPGDKTKAGTGIDGFTVAAFTNNTNGNSNLAFSYGQTLTQHLGGLAFDPSAERPDFEFTIANFSQLPGFDAAQGFNVRAFAGTPDDIVAGEDQIPWEHVSFPTVDAQVPEPATLLAWTVLMGASWRLRRCRRQSS